MVFETLTYCAQPSRQAHLKRQVTEYVSEIGFAPFHPFDAFLRELYEDGPIGREGTMKVCLEAAVWCPKFALFGVSRGTLQEAQRRRERGKSIVLIDGFDTERERYYRKHAEEYGNPLEGLDWVRKEEIERVKALLSRA